MCDPKRCRGDRADPAVNEPAAAALPLSDQAPGGIEQAVAALINGLNYDADDPRTILSMLAVQLARHIDEGGAVPAAVRELRTVLAQISEAPNGPSSQLDEIRVQRTRRRLDSLIIQAS